MFSCIFLIFIIYIQLVNAIKLKVIFKCISQKSIQFIAKAKEFSEGKPIDFTNPSTKMSISKLQKHPSQSISDRSH